MSKNTLHPVGEKPREKALIFAIVPKGTDTAVLTEHLDELALLLDTAGADVADRLYQERVKPDPGWAVGKGKIEEIRELAAEHDVDMIVFDDELSPIQVKNLEEELAIKVLDRSGVILDIFAAHAKSLESRTQVELAQLQYLMPRLTGMWTHLSKQFGGVGSKGPGETQIETDRRMFRRRIQRLKEKLKEIEIQRIVQTKGRGSLARFALVGYTNAGKSSLMRAITGTDLYIKDQLFATLDTTVRSFELLSGQKVLISDTVGFIRKLPHQLVASFRSTLAETLEADVLIHVVDASHEHARDHIEVVNATLKELGAEDKPMLLVFNKIDALEDKYVIDDMESEYPGAIFVSALRSINLQRLLKEMQQAIEELSVVRTLMVPYEQAKAVSKVYSDSEVLERKDNDNGTTLVVKVSADKLSAFENEFASFIGLASV